MRVFVYEYLTACGIGRDPSDPLHAMFREGRAMRDAAAADFAGIPGCSVIQMEDGDRERFATCAARAEWSLVIAPESGGILEERCRWVEDAGGRLLGPSSAAVKLTADKHTLANHWREHGVPTPATTDRAPTACEAFPLVWKPRDGAGSTDTFLLRDAFDVARAKATTASGGTMILQEYVPGRAASVAFLCGPAGAVPLLPAFQELSTDGRFHYRGGVVPIPPDLAIRAVQLGSRSIGYMPGLRGYVGVDLVLGDAADGSGDFAIEINPRLTTSYVGLRALAEFNLATAMIRVALGEPVADLTWKPGIVRFASDGSPLAASQEAAPGASCVAASGQIAL